MTSNNIEQVLYNIRRLTPNHPNYSIKREETFTHKQWKYNMALTAMKENTRKKSTRLSTRVEEKITSIDDLNKLLDIESRKQYTKKWNKLTKIFKINRLMTYYNKSFDEILKVFATINDRDVEYDETTGKITNCYANIFNSDNE